MKFEAWLPWYASAKVVVEAETEAEARKKIQSHSYDEEPWLCSACADHIEIDAGPVENGKYEISVSEDQ